MFRKLPIFRAYEPLVWTVTVLCRLPPMLRLCRADFFRLAFRSGLTFVSDGLLLAKPPPPTVMSIRLPGWSEIRLSLLYLLASIERSPDWSVLMRLEKSAAFVRELSPLILLMRDASIDEYALLLLPRFDCS